MIKNIFFLLTISGYAWGMEKALKKEDALQCVVIHQLQQLTPCTWDVYRGALADIGHMLTRVSLNKYCHQMFNGKKGCKKIIRTISEATGTTDLQVVEQFFEHSQCKKIYTMIESAFNPKAFILDEWYLNTTKICEPDVMDDLHRSYDGGKLPPLSVAIKLLDRDWINKLVAQGADVNKLYLSGKDIIRPLYEVIRICIEAKEEEQEEQEYRSEHKNDKNLCYYIMSILLKTGARVDALSILEVGQSDTAWKLAVRLRAKTCVRVLWTQGKYDSQEHREKCCVLSVADMDWAWFNSLGLQ